MVVFQVYFHKLLFIILGEMSVMYLFLRYKFHWNELNFSIFNSYQMTIVLLGKI